MLGAGGRVGFAYHAGTLLGLSLQGLDVGGATSVTGTSAGSVAAALLVAGAAPEDLAALAVGAPARPDIAELGAAAAAGELARPRISAHGVANLLHPWRPVGVVREVLAGRLRSGMTGALPGLADLRHRLRFLDRVEPTAVRSLPWRVVAVGSSGRRHVFSGAGRSIPSLAVAASCAVPGVYAPVRHGGDRLVDGGVHSTTNADLVDEDVGDVVVVAPMCGGRSNRAVLTGHARRQLLAELAVLHRSGRRVVVLRPSDELRALMGVNLLSKARARSIVGASLLEIGGRVLRSAERAA